jgi:hypothetical protein
MAEIETNTDSAPEKAPSRDWLVWMALSLTTAVTSSIRIFYSDFWWDLFDGRSWLIDLVRFTSLPLWLLTTCMAFVRFPGARKKLWWLLAPAPLCFWPVVRVLLTFLAWSVNGFAP